MLLYTIIEETKLFSLPKKTRYNVFICNEHVRANGRQINNYYHAYLLDLRHNK